MGTIGLAKALAMLREAEAEFLVEIDAEGGAEAGGSIGVVTLKAGGKVSWADTHRLKLKLCITDASTGGRNLEVRRDQARGWKE